MPPGRPNRELMADIQEVGERAAGLTRQILAFSRRQILKPETLHLNDIVLDLEPLLRRSLGEDVELEFSLAPDLRQSEIDPHQMDQVLMNLAVNAQGRHAGRGAAYHRNGQCQVGQHLRSGSPGSQARPLRDVGRLRHRLRYG